MTKTKHRVVTAGSKVTKTKHRVVTAGSKVNKKKQLAGHKRSRKIIAKSRKLKNTNIAQKGRGSDKG